ncbi:MULTISPECIES: hypothetical protein [Idiomarina]|uniref:hypothetical protein n=1 Tax=Idiomarina TaxID=135575 RepID=UPI000C094A00|nr:MULTISPECIES: hypothetical protein [Idiomarina]MAC35590.1 hypothetical protein [Haliea sp.]MAO67900.1 hypothetical protein [Idiomarina sp.]MBF79642.1 hypothetical protein [Idiomarina sp.]|tara:strand:- start:21454 stop:21789 length:336 start_codon:yes stop_codon:yes gene_type:complete
MMFTAEVNITSQDGFDMTLDCPSPGIPPVKQYLKHEGFTILDEKVSIKGTKNISDLIELEVAGSDFAKLRAAIIRFLKSRNVKYTEEQFNSTGELNSRFNLDDISVFDKTI